MLMLVDPEEATHRYMTSKEPGGYIYLKADSDEELVAAGYSRVKLQYRTGKHFWEWCKIEEVKK